MLYKEKPHILNFCAIISNGSNIIWNGPLGMFEKVNYATGTESVCHEIKNRSVSNKCVSIIGGGDTGADCIGTALRHGCRSIMNLELLPQPSVERTIDNQWPNWPEIFRTEYSHSEAIARFGSDPRSYSVVTKEFLDNGNGGVNGLSTRKVIWQLKGEGQQLVEIAGGEARWQADLILLAMGFLGPEKCTFICFI